MNFIEELAAKRRKLLEGIEANEGDINLGIFEDFYPDEAHFIYELLQNAEDADATEASFELEPHRCAFVHNGPRHFDEDDIKSITGIFSSSKKDNAEKIGKFGVGFKSVFVYTDTPIVYSKNFSFRISQLVLPESVEKKAELDANTRFEFPFNNAKKNATQAFSEIKAGLEDISETTLLFLNNLQCIYWKIGNLQGAVLREKHSEVHIEVVKEAENSKVVSTHWLRFTAPVVGLIKQKVAVAYELSFLGDKESFDPKLPLAKQMKIVPAEPGRVAVFFPAEKETSGLRFHLHAPFIPELSRASIKNSPANTPLFEQLSCLAAHSLHEVKRLGLLSGEFLAVLPNNDETLPERYRVIRESIIRAMREQPLTPTQNKEHAPAKNLFQARATLKELLSDEDMAFLLPNAENPRWAIGAPQKNNAQDRFLSSLEIKTWDADSLIAVFKERAYCRNDCHADPIFINWLTRQTNEWHQQLYALLYLHLTEKGDFSKFDGIVIIRLEDGNYVHAAGDSIYFPCVNTDKSDPFQRVMAAILTAGNKQIQQGEARKFLVKIGVKEVGDADEISHILDARYSKKSTVPTDEIYRADLQQFMAYLEKNPKKKEIFQRAYIFKVESHVCETANPAHVYLDIPFKETGLRFYHEALTDEKQKKWGLTTWYSKNGIESSELAAFAEALGATIDFSEFIVETICENNPRWDYLQQAPGKRSGTHIDEDYSISPEMDELLQSNNTDFSRLVWRTMCSLKSFYLWATYQKNQKSGPLKAESSLISRLRESEWIPIKGGEFVKPRNANQDTLLKGFAFDTGYKWLGLVEFGKGEKEKSAEDAALERVQAFSKLPQEEQERILEEYKRRTTEPPEEFPEQPVRNKELRNQRVQDEALQTPDKETQIRQRSLALRYEAVKSEAKLYLREQYTNSNGVMFCQLCNKLPLPFRLPNGAYYFEAVESVAGLSKRYRETFLALCPNHAAMFLYANEQKETIQELLETAVGIEVELTLGGKAQTILFTETHIADIQSCLRVTEQTEQ
jgi:hypothetical protein